MLYANYAVHVLRSATNHAKIVTPVVKVCNGFNFTLLERKTETIYSPSTASYPDPESLD